MKNPANNINVFEIEITSKKDLNHPYIKIVTAYTKSGNCYAFHGYSDEVIGKAGGWGYDKTHTALLQGIEKILGVELDANGAAGFESVAAGLKKLKKGYKLTKII